jgi:hypothetical protein
MMSIVKDEVVTQGTGLLPFCSAEQYRPQPILTWLFISSLKTCLLSDTCPPLHAEVAVKLCQNASIVDCMSICRTAK